MTIYLNHSRARLARGVGIAQAGTDWIGKVQHLVAGGPLLVVGMRHVHEGSSGEIVSGIFEILIAAAVLMTFVIELRGVWRKTSGSHQGKVRHARFDWFDLAAGTFLLYEAFHGRHMKPFYQRAHFYAGMLSLIVGVTHHRLTEFSRRRLYLRVDEVGLDCRTRLFRRMTLRWAVIASVQPSENGCTIRLVNGATCELNLEPFSNRRAAEQALLERAAAVAAVSGKTAAS